MATLSPHTGDNAQMGSSSSSSKVDPKLLHLVRKLMNVSYENPAIASCPNQADYIVTVLRTQHREYQRKDIGRLKSSVVVALRQIMSSATSASSQHHSSENLTRLGAEDGDKESKITSSGRKRKSSAKELEEQRGEAIALAHDASREAMNQMTGGGLNAGLRNRYRQVQLDRDKQQKEQQSLESGASQEGQNNPDSNLSISESPTEKMDNTTHGNNNNAAIPDGTESSRKKRQKSPVADISTTAMHDETLPISTVGKHSKRRKIKSERRSSSNRNLPGMSPSENNSTAFLNPVPRPTERYTDLGGMHDIIKEIRQLVEYPLVRPELYQHLGVDPPRGVLLRGPPGTGKTHLANAVAGQLGVPFFRVSAPELVSGMSGESESRIRDLFQVASNSAPALIFMDELDAIAPKRGGDGRGMEKRMVAQLLTSMDQVAPANNRNRNAVIILAASNRPDAMDPALRRAGRFDREILLGVPDEDARERIIQTMTLKMRLCGNFDCKLLARRTPGFVGADIRSLAKEAAVIAINRIFRDVLQDHKKVEQPLPPIVEGKQDQDGTTEEDDLLSTKAVVDASSDSTKEFDSATDVIPLTEEQMEPLYVTMEDFEAALPLVQPSAKREGFATVPDVTWDDIGALHSTREELTISVLEPIRCPEKFQQLGIPLPAGVMLYGPPGCGKTLLAKAIAHESGANFISIKGPELLDKYVGESEKAVRLVFERARSSSPCVVFFDELDSLVPKRGSDGGGGGGVSERVVNQLLTEMDGLESRRSVFVIAATNRPELIDPAMMRPGRLDKLLYVPLPTAEERVHILRALAKKVKLNDDVDLAKIARSPRAEGYSGADCAALLREAGLAVLKEDIAQNSKDGSGSISGVSLSIRDRHFSAAFQAVMPSVSKKDQARYDRIRDRMARARSRGETNANEDDPIRIEGIAADKATVDAVAGSNEGSADNGVVAPSPEEQVPSIDRLTNLEIMIKKKPHKRHKNRHHVNDKSKDKSRKSRSENSETNENENENESDGEGEKPIDTALA